MILFLKQNSLVNHLKEFLIIARINKTNDLNKGNNFKIIPIEISINLLLRINLNFSLVQSPAMEIHQSTQIFLASLGVYSPQHQKSLFNAKNMLIFLLFVITIVLIIIFLLFEAKNFEEFTNALSALAAAMFTITCFTIFVLNRDQLFKCTRDFTNIIDRSESYKSINWHTKYFKIEYFRDWRCSTKSHLRKIQPPSGKVEQNVSFDFN